MDALKPRETDDSGGSGALVSVVVLNDDITPMEYVLEVICMVFRMNHSNGITVVTKAHNTGSALVGMYPETKAEQLLRKVDKMNSDSGNSLRCVIVDIEQTN